MKEIWKTIPRYPDCEASNLGNVRYKEGCVPAKCYTGRYRPKHKSNVGYFNVRICSKVELIH